MRINSVEQFASYWIANAFVPIDDFSRVRETLWGLGCDSNWRLIAPSEGKGYLGKITIPSQQVLASIKLLYGSSTWWVWDAR